MIRHPLISHYNAPYRGPKDKMRINTALNSIKIDILNIKKYASFVNAKAISITKGYLFGADNNDNNQFSSHLNVSRVINNNVEQMFNMEVMSSREMTSKIKNCDMQLDFMLNNVKRKNEI